MSLFEDNIKALQRNSPEMASLAAGIFLPEDMPIYPSVSGLPTLMVNNGNGQQYFLHSPVDPIAEAKELIADKSFMDNDATILFGFGLGYLGMEILKSMSPDHDLFVVEHRSDIFRLALENIDLRKIFEDQRVRFCLFSDSFEFLDRLTHIQKKAIFGKIQKLIYQPAAGLASEKYQKLDDDINVFVDTAKLSLSSFQVQSKTRIKNLFSNMTVLSQATSAVELRSVFKDIPSIIVSGGPSLDKNIETIRHASGKAVIIGVDTSLKPLLSKGVTPNIVVTLESHDVNYKKIEGIETQCIRDISLVFDPEGNYRIPKKFSGPKFFINTMNTFSDWLISLSTDLPDFPRMLTVSNTAFCLARYLGCNPIVLTGFDFSFPEDKHHAEGSSMTWKPDFEGGQFEEIDSIYGHKVKTIDQFIYMRNCLEREIAKTKALCIDATEGGALIRGTEIMPLQIAITEYLSNKNIDINYRLKNVVSNKSGLNPEKTINGLKWLKSEIDQITIVINQARSLIKRYKGIADGNSAIAESNDSMLSQLHELRNKIISKTELLDIIGDFLEKLLIAEAKWNAKNHILNMQQYEFFFDEVDEAIQRVEKGFKGYMNID